MKNTFVSYLWRLTSLSICLVLITGCGSNESNATATIELPTIPEQVEMDGEKWTHLEGMDQKLETRLTRYFREYPSIAENPAISGSPEVFEASDGRLRFVWRKAMGKTIHWCFIEQSGRKWNFADGTGELFKTN